MKRDWIIERRCCHLDRWKRITSFASADRAKDALLAWPRSPFSDYRMIRHRTTGHVVLAVEAER